MFGANEDLKWLFNRKLLKRAGLGSIVCIVLVYLITMPVFIEPLYQAETIVYVPLSILSQQLDQHGIGFGSEKEIDWYIQILKSNQMSDSLILKYYPELQDDKSETFEKSKVYHLLAKKIGIEKNRYGSLSIIVKDKSPEKAAIIANEIVYLGEIIKSEVLKSNRLEALHYTRELFEQKSKELNEIKTKLDSIKESTAKFSDQAKLELESLQTVYNLELQVFISRKNLYEVEKRNFKTQLPKIYVISEAVSNEQAVWPNRKLIIPAAVFTYLLVLLVFEIVIYDFRKETK